MYMIRRCNVLMIGVTGVISSGLLPLQSLDSYSFCLVPIASSPSFLDFMIFLIYRETFSNVKNMVNTFYELGCIKCSRLDRFCAHSDWYSAIWSCRGREVISNSRKCLAKPNTAGGPGPNKAISAGAFLS